METKIKSRKKGSVKPVPEGFYSITPYLMVDGATEFIEFTKKAFGGKLTFITKRDDGKVVHATVKIGNSILMISDTMENMPRETAMLFLYLDNMDSVYRKAINAGGISQREPRDEFYGDRSACVKDAWGNKWWIATHIEDVSPKELDKRSKAAQKHQEVEV